MTVPLYTVNVATRIAAAILRVVVLGLVLSGGFVGLGMLGPGAAAVRAEEAPPPAAVTSITAIGSITAPADGAFVPRNTVVVAGQKATGGSVSVRVAGGGPQPPASGCSSPVEQAAATTWSCTAVLPNGPGVVVTATETDDNGAETSDAVTVDVLGPPGNTTLAVPATPAVASGTGYPGAKIRLMVGGVEQDCPAVVGSDHTWVCTIANGPGNYAVSASQVHPAVGSPPGTSAASPSVALEVRQAPPTNTPAPVVPSRPKPLPVPQSPPEPAHHEPEPSPSATPSHRADASTLPWLDRPVFPSDGDGGPTVREALTNWGTPTGFGAQLPTLAQTVSGGSWLWAPLMALLFIGLVAVPLRMLVTAVHHRLAFGRMRLTGRNRLTPPPEEPVTARNPWLMGAVPVAATAGLIVLAEGLNGEVRYVRLLFAVGLALSILNVVGVAVVTRVVAHATGIRSRLKFLPALLIAAAIATALSRVTGIDPPLVGGVLIGAGFALSVPARPRALVNLGQVGAVVVIALAGWVGHQLLGPVDGFWPSVASETLAGLCLAGVGSALILILPLGALPGRAILEWSTAAWFVAALTVATVAAVMLLGGAPATFPVLASAVIVTGFAAVCLAVGAWAYYARGAAA
jgi:hypothetical protein